MGDRNGEESVQARKIMEVVDTIVSLWPVAAGIFLLVLTIGRILNRLEVLESKMIEAWKAINELIRK